MHAFRLIRDAALDLCLGCRHDRTTRPFTIQDESYMVCLDCGKQLFYSVETMRRLSGRELRHLRAMRNADVAAPGKPPSSALPAKTSGTHVAA